MAFESFGERQNEDKKRNDSPATKEDGIAKRIPNLSCRKARVQGGPKGAVEVSKYSKNILGW